MGINFTEFFMLTFYCDCTLVDLIGIWIIVGSSLLDIEFVVSSQSCWYTFGYSFMESTNWYEAGHYESWHGPFATCCILYAL